MKLQVVIGFHDDSNLSGEFVTVEREVDARPEFAMFWQEPNTNEPNESLYDASELLYDAVEPIIEQAQVSIEPVAIEPGDVLCFKLVDYDTGYGLERHASQRFFFEENESIRRTLRQYPAKLANKIADVIVERLKNG